jgi:hypothetical protein
MVLVQIIGGRSAIATGMLILDDVPDVLEAVASAVPGLSVLRV